MLTIDAEALRGLLVAILGGAAVGLERQRSGHATGPHARLGGIRTLTLLGTLAGIAGVFSAAGQEWLAALLVAGAVALIAASYVRASKKDIDATTEVAAIVVVGAGVLAGLGQVQLSAALTTLTVLLLTEKSRLHRLAARLDDTTTRAAARFAVMSTVILPLLPEGPFGPDPGVRPRELWMLVLLFTGLSFAGFLMHRVSGAAGYPLAGVLGGLVSSTSVTLAFARLSLAHPQQAKALATGAVSASTVLFLRVGLAVALLNTAMLPALTRYLAAPLLVAMMALAMSWRSLRDTHRSTALLKNPLQFRSAIEMALLFQVVLFAVFYVRARIGDAGVMMSGFVLGLTDVDALTLSMVRSVSGGTTIDAATRAIALGVIANALMKAAISVVIGDRRFKWQVGLSLSLMAAAGTVMVIFF